MPDKLGSVVQKYAQSHPLDKRFRWDFPLAGLPQPIVQSLPEGNGFDRNVALKNCLRPHLRCNGYNDYRVEYWIIQAWGGIRSFKKNANNDRRITDFYNKLDKSSLTKDLFGCISSLSKVASFFNPNDYAIYDSRAIYTLNWLLLKSGATDSFFPIPAGRNAEIAKYDMETIIRLNFGGKSNLFFDHKTAYFRYCDLLKQLSLEIWETEERKRKPFYLEMLLFALSPEEIVDDIKKSAKIEIQTNG